MQYTQSPSRKNYIFLYISHVKSTRLSRGSAGSDGRDTFTQSNGSLMTQNEIIIPNTCWCAKWANKKVGKHNSFVEKIINILRDPCKVINICVNLSMWLLLRAYSYEQRQFSSGLVGCYIFSCHRRCFHLLCYNNIVLGVFSRYFEWVCTAHFVTDQLCRVKMISFFLIFGLEQKLNVFLVEKSNLIISLALLNGYATICDVAFGVRWLTSVAIVKSS